MDALMNDFEEYIKSEQDTFDIEDIKTNIKTSWIRMKKD